MYLQRAIYFAPSEIRACCQRFFCEGELKGDASLIKIEDTNNPVKVRYEDIVNAKYALIESINRGEDTQCTGCPYLSESSWPALDIEQIDTVSIEHHSVCNMRCTYCSDVYYGGKKPSYSVAEVLNQLPEVGSNLHVAWGGGEPAMDKDFVANFKLVTDKLKPKTQRIFSNALLYSGEIQDAIDDGLAYLTTSIDAGTEKTFRVVRKAKKLDRVIKNLKRYAATRPEMVTIKYIFTEDNYGLEEIEAFVELIGNADLKSCSYLISADFKDEYITDEKIVSIMVLDYLLRAMKVYSVTLDDIIYKRVQHVAKRLLTSQFTLPIEFQKHELFGRLALELENISRENIVIWGTGEFSKLLLKNSQYLNHANITAVVDSDRNRWGTQFRTYVIEDPRMLANNNARIVVASSNFHGDIVRKIRDLGINLERIVPTYLL